MKSLLTGGVIDVVPPPSKRDYDSVASLITDLRTRIFSLEKDVAKERAERANLESSMTKEREMRDRVEIQLSAAKSEAASSRAECEQMRQRMADKDAQIADGMRQCSQMCEAHAREVAGMKESHDREMKSVRDGYQGTERRHKDVLSAIERSGSKQIQMPMPISEPLDYDAVVVERDPNGRASRIVLKPRR